MPSALQMVAQTPGPLGIPSLELRFHQLYFLECIDGRTINLLPILLYFNNKCSHQFQLFSLQTCKKIKSTAASLRKKLWKTSIGKNLKEYGKYVRHIRAKQLLCSHYCSKGSDFIFMNITLLNQESSSYFLPWLRLILVDPNLHFQECCSM